VAVQTGEGTIEIIYGTTSIPAGPDVFGGYLARPDGMGQWPTVLVFGPEPVPTSSVKNICRVLARHGIAALAPDLTSDHAVNETMVVKIVAFVTDPTGHWSNAQLGYGALAFAYGIYDASSHAVRSDKVAALAAVGTAFDDVVGDDLATAGVPMLYVASRGDGSESTDAALGARDDLPLTTFVVYQDAESGWWNDDADGFDAALADDTFDRVLSFFAEHLPTRI
jgi:dienelactone hydrolase